MLKAFLGHHISLGYPFIFKGKALKSIRNLIGTRLQIGRFPFRASSYGAGTSSVTPQMPEFRQLFPVTNYFCREQSSN